VTKPFLKWAGGKTQILRQLMSFLPENCANRTYHEPFLGAGSMFFGVRPRTAHLNDANPLLIRCYESVRENPELISHYLQEHRRSDSENYYYHIREIFNNAKRFSTAQAARFIYLNKACFNGIYRVNQQNHFNVPYGHKPSLAIPTTEELSQVAQALETAVLYNGSYETVLANANEGDFVYLDPPYPPLNGTSYFTHYTPERFTHEDHVRLADVFKKLSQRGCLVMMSNAKTERISQLFEGFNFYTLDVIRYISCKCKKHRVEEVVITNYRHA